MMYTVNQVLLGSAVPEDVDVHAVVNSTGPLHCCLIAVQCGCGGTLNVLRTTEEAKEKYGYTSDKWIGCSRWRNKNPCKGRFQIAQLQDEVARFAAEVRVGRRMD